MYGEEVPETTADNASEEIRKFVGDKLKMIIPSNNIVSLCKIKTKKDNIHGPYLLKFNNCEIKKRLVEQCRVIKPKFYLNEDLSPEKRAIMCVLRQCKRNHSNIVKSCSVLDGRVCAWIKTNENMEKNQRIFINTQDKLREFCANKLGAGMESFIKKWPQ